MCGEKNFTDICKNMISVDVEIDYNFTLIFNYFLPFYEKCADF